MYGERQQMVAPGLIAAHREIYGKGEQEQRPVHCVFRLRGKRRRVDEKTGNLFQRTQPFVVDYGVKIIVVEWVVQRIDIDQTGTCCQQRIAEIRRSLTYEFCPIQTSLNPL